MNPAVAPIQWHPAVKIAARIVALLAGTALMLATAFVSAFAFGLNGCEDPLEDGQTTAFCDNFAGALPWLETTFSFIAILAPFVAGICTCATGKARGLVWGAAVWAVGVALMVLVLSGLMRTGQLT